jgi:hypothetical protein
MVDSLDFGGNDAMLFGDMSGISLPPNGLEQLTMMEHHSTASNSSSNGSGGNSNGVTAVGTPLNADWSHALPPMMTSSIPLMLSTGSISMTFGLDEPIAHVAGESSTGVLALAAANIVPATAAIAATTVDYDHPPPLQPDQDHQSQTLAAMVAQSPMSATMVAMISPTHAVTVSSSSSSTNGTASGEGVLAPYLLHVPSKFVGDDRPCPFGCGKMYKRSSQRALSKHLLVCRRRPPEADDAQLQQLASVGSHLIISFHFYIYPLAN